jgi:DNA-binding NtrC family response regulator
MKRILIIDDDEAFCSAICTALKRAGFEVMGAHDGRTALKLHSETKFDLVISDMLMPEIDGVELIVALRKRDPAASIIAMSAGGFIAPDNYLRIARSLGVSSLQKPFTLSSLIELVTSKINPCQTLAVEGGMVELIA